MTLVHEKGSAPAEDGPSLTEENHAVEGEELDSIVPGGKGNPWSERLSIRLDPVLLGSFLLGNAAIVLGILGSVWGGHGA